MNQLTQPVDGYFHLHFKVDDHTLPVDDLVKSLIGVKKVIANLNKELFQGKVKYQLVAFPPQKGTFLESLALYIYENKEVIGAGFGATVAFLETEIGKGLCKGLTGKEPRQIVEETAKATVTNLSELAQEHKKTFIAATLATSAACFLTKSSSEIKSLGLETEHYITALEGKNEIYEVCESNDKIQAIGFDLSENFPVTRQDYPKMFANIPEKSDSEDEWVIEKVNVSVISPTWSKEGRNWVGTFKNDDNKIREAHFKIEDDDFWLKVMNSELTDLDTGDKAFVQWARCRKKGAITAKVLRVIRYNSQEVSSPLSESEQAVAMGNLKYKGDDAPAEADFMHLLLP